MILTSLIGAVTLPFFNEPAVLDIEGVIAGANLHLAVRIGLGNDAVIHCGNNFVARMRDRPP